MAAIPGVAQLIFLGEEPCTRFDLDALAAREHVTVHPIDMRPVERRQLWHWRPVLKGVSIDAMFYPYHLGASPFHGAPPQVVLVHDCIFETNARYAPDLKTAIAYRAATEAIIRTSTVLTVSESSACEVRKYYHRQAVVIGNGVDQHLHGGPPELARLRAEFGLPQEYVLHVGVQRPHKNVPVLVEAIAAVPGLHLVLVGTPDERFEDKVGPAIERFGVADRVLRLPFVPEELLGALYAAADVFAYPSLVEGFGLPMLEAMEAGTPVIAADVPILREVGGAAALYAPPRDPGAWAASIRRLRADRDLRMKLRDEGRDKAKQHTWAQAARRLVDACATAARRPCPGEARPCPGEVRPCPGEVRPYSGEVRKEASATTSDASWRTK
jgi:glycosyltransferase involved in cell wall biosynthesis